MAAPLAPIMNRWTLAPANRALLDTFPSTATVLRKTQVRDTTGGFTNTYASVASYPCMFRRYPFRPLERESAVRVQALIHWEFHFLIGTDVRLTDRLQVGTRTFEVAGAGAGNSDVFLTIHAMEIV